MKTIIYLFAVSISVLIIYSCERIFGGEDDRLVIINNSNVRLYVYAQINHPDTSIGSYNPAYSKINYEVLPNSQKHIISRSWEQTIVSSVSDTLMLFIFDADLIDNTSWNTVVTNYMILKRYDFSLVDLKTLNWKVSYP